MATRYEILKDRIELKLNAIAKIQEVADYAKLAFSGYPAATIVPLQGEADYQTTIEDTRVYAFRIDIFYESDANGSQGAINALYDLVDDVLDSFAEDAQLTDDGALGLPAGDIVIDVRPVSAGWEEMPEQKLLIATINLNIALQININ